MSHEKIYLINQKNRKEINITLFRIICFKFNNAVIINKSPQNAYKIIHHKNEFNNM